MDLYRWLLCLVTEFRIVLFLSAHLLFQTFLVRSSYHLSCGSADDVDTDADDVGDGDDENDYFHQ